MKNLLKISKSGYFYKNDTHSLIEEFKKIIDRLFNEEKDITKDFEEYKIAYSIENFDTHYTLVVFNYEQNVPFLANPNFKEKKYGFFLLLEYSNHIVIAKKNSDILLKYIKKKLSKIEYKTISNAFIDKNSRYETLSYKNTDLTLYSVKNNTVSSFDLKISLPTFALYNRILGKMNVITGKRKYKLDLMNSKIQESKSLSFEEWVKWACEKINVIEGYSNTKESRFINNFAEIHESISSATITPISIYISLIDISLDEYDKIIYEDQEISLEDVQGFFHEQLEIKKDIKGNYYFEVSNYGKGYVKVGAKGIKLRFPAFNKIKISQSEEENPISLSKYLNDHGLFTIGFKGGHVFYTSNNYFFIDTFLKNYQTILDIIKTNDNLKITQSEKGLPTQLNANSTKFPNDSCFKIVEDIFTNQKHLICDDMGKEWADFISLDDEEINFIHVKHEKISDYTTLGISATNFHVVTSQAQKNISTLINRKEFFIKKKMQNFKQTSFHKNTRIKKIRRSENNSNDINKEIEETFNYYLKIMNKFNLRKRVTIVINYLSKKVLSDELDKALQQKSDLRLEVIQLFSLLSGLANFCKNLTVELEIICCS